MGGIGVVNDGMNWWSNLDGDWETMQRQNIVKNKAYWVAGNYDGKRELRTYEALNEGAAVERATSEGLVALTKCEEIKE